VFLRLLPTLRTSGEEASRNANVNEITSALIELSTHALAHDDRQWMERFAWLGEAWDRLFKDQPAVSLDG
jgi:hypothetical protein